MTAFTYTCNKTGYSVTIPDVAKLPASSVQYALFKGLREFYDNYHCNITRKAFGARPDFTKMVNDSVDEAHARMLAGTPGQKGTGSVDITKLSDAELTAELARRKAKAA